MFEVDMYVVCQSRTIKSIIEDTGPEAPVPLPNVSGRILAKVIEYSKFHADDAQKKDDEEVKRWDEAFMQVDNETLFELVLVSMGKSV
jgi:S-phase kinase-associated protein 1